MANNNRKRTIEDKLLQGHKERVDGLTAFAMIIMKDACEANIPEGILWSSARNFAERWLRQEVKTDENEDSGE